MAQREGRIQPLQANDPRRPVTAVATLSHAALHRDQPLSQGFDQVDARVLHLRHGAHRRDRIEDALDGGGLKRDDGDVHIDPARDLVHFAIAHRADAAQLLRDDQVGLRRFQGRLIQLVERRAAVHGCRDPRVDLAGAKRAEILRVTGDDRFADDDGRPVAFVGHADEFVAQTDRADDLRGRREERDDSHDQVIRR